MEKDPTFLLSEQLHSLLDETYSSISSLYFDTTSDLLTAAAENIKSIVSFDYSLTFKVGDILQNFSKEIKADFYKSLQAFTDAFSTTDLTNLTNGLLDSARVLSESKDAYYELYESLPEEVQQLEELPAPSSLKDKIWTVENIKWFIGILITIIIAITSNLDNNKNAEGSASDIEANRIAQEQLLIEQERNELLSKTNDILNSLSDYLQIIVESTECSENDIEAVIDDENILLDTPQSEEHSHLEHQE